MIEFFDANFCFENTWIAQRPPEFRNRLVQAMESARDQGSFIRERTTEQAINLFRQGTKRENPQQRQRNQTKGQSNKGTEDLSVKMKMGTEH